MEDVVRVISVARVVGLAAGVTVVIGANDMDSVDGVGGFEVTGVVVVGIDSLAGVDVIGAALGATGVARVARVVVPEEVAGVARLVGVVGVTRLVVVEDVDAVD